MHILYSAPDIDIAAGHGGSGHVTGVLQALHKARHDVTVIVQHTQRTWNGMRVIPYKRPTFRIIRALFAYFIPFFIAFYYCATRKTDLVYERAKIFGGGAVSAARLWRIPSVYEMNEPIPFALGKEGWKDHFIGWWHRRSARRATLTTGTHDSFFTGLDTTRCLLIDYGTDPALFTPTHWHGQKAKTILYTGSFATWHACDHVIEAARILAKKHKDIHFLLLGTGDQWQTCNDLVKKYRLGTTVSLPGKVAHDLIPGYIQEATICLALFDRNYPLFTKYDYFYSPIKVHEYKACGKPVVASDIGNLRRIVRDGVNGLLVNEKDPAAIAHAIQHLLENQKLYARISRRNRDDIEEIYNWETINQQILDRVQALSTQKHRT